MSKTLAPIETLIFIDDTGVRLSPGDMAMNAQQITNMLERPVAASGSAYWSPRQTSNTLSDEIQAGLNKMSHRNNITVVVIGDVSDAEQTEIKEHFPDIEILFATELKKVAVLIGWGDFSPEFSGSLHNKLHELHQLEDDITVQGMIQRTVSKFPQLATADMLYNAVELMLKMYATSKASFDIVACYVVTEMSVEQFEELMRPLVAQYDFPISLQPPSDLAA